MIKNEIINILQSSTPDYLKNIIPGNIRNWINEKIKPDDVYVFDGWGMKNKHELPWNCNKGNKMFLQSVKDIKEHFDFSGDGGVNISNVDSLLWRHWIVSYCIRYINEFINDDLPLVECGVCDGLSSYFALNEFRGLGHCADMHLYDAWSPMKQEYLLESEQHSIGRYQNISLDRVKKNLSKFDNVIYHPGYIPESLSIKPSSPDKISYLSIDLNSSFPTTSALKYFFPKLVRRGVILFDDYGWMSYKDTKKAVDIFFSDKPGILMPLPTGQAIYYK